MESEALEFAPSAVESGSGLPAVTPVSTAGAESAVLPPAPGGRAAQELASAASMAAAVGGGSFMQRLLKAPPSMHTAVLSHDGTVLYTGADPVLFSPYF